VGALLLAPGCCDPLYRRAVRVSMGHVLAVPYATLEPWPEGLKQLADAGFRLVALTPDPSAAAIDDLGLRGTGRVALLLGAEDRGLTAEAMAQAHVRARIPMAAGVDSLNVASAAAIAFYAAGAPAAGAGWPAAGPTVATASGPSTADPHSQEGERV
jgi:tRNA G18 (ribose-2'-O)-methylase SpoU